LDPQATGLSDLTELLLYAASRAQHVSEKIGPALEGGGHVICDRFTASTWAYQGYGRNLDLSLIGQVTRIAAAGCEPDLTFYLKVPIQVAAARRAKRGQSPDRLELEGDDFQLRVASGYEQVAASDLRGGVVLDGSEAREEVAHEVWRNLLERWPHFPAMVKS
jgi:dTMP kinase